MKSRSVLGFPLWFFILIWVFILFIFNLSPETCEEGSYIYRLHCVTPGIPSKFTYHHCIGFLQMCKSLKKSKALELRIALWHVGYMWFFYLFLCAASFFFLFGRFSGRITWKIKTINWKFSINFIKKDKTNKINRFLFYLLKIYHFLIAF